jgi:hypothetical protein
MICNLLSNYDFRLVKKSIINIGVKYEIIDESKNIIKFNFRCFKTLKQDLSYCGYVLHEYGCKQKLLFFDGYDSSKLLCPHCKKQCKLDNNILHEISKNLEIINISEPYDHEPRYGAHIIYF